MRKTTSFFMLAPACAIALAAVVAPAAPVHAGFILEGLQPFSVRACPDGEFYGDPIVAAPRSAIVGSPSKYNDGNIPPFQPQNCPSESAKMGKSPVQKKPVAQK